MLGNFSASGQETCHGTSIAQRLLRFVQTQPLAGATGRHYSSAGVSRLRPYSFAWPEAGKSRRLFLSRNIFMSQKNSHEGNVKAEYFGLSQL